MPKTKIICTLGPASDNQTIIRKMAFAGMDVARLNFSHGTYSEHYKKIELVRAFNKKYRRRIIILQDLEGNRIRVGSLANHKPVQLKKHTPIHITNDGTIGNNEIISIDYENSLSDIKPGNLIFIDDGNIRLRVTKSSYKMLTAAVEIGGELKENKGVNIPSAKLNFATINDKDKADLEFGIAHKVDFIAQSFVRTSEDILAVRKIINKKLPDCKIIAKIENRDGVNNLNDIMEVSDGIMVARGDMGVALPIYEVPLIQKKIISLCNKKKKFVITATQMLESMVENFIPTRAEVSDVANAIIDGTDYVMLSAESAVGKYPVETVKMMNNIIVFTEHHLKSRR